MWSCIAFITDQGIPACDIENIRTQCDWKQNDVCCMHILCKIHRGISVLIQNRQYLSPFIGKKEKERGICGWVVMGATVAQLVRAPGRTLFVSCTNWSYTSSRIFGILLAVSGTLTVFIGVVYRSLPFDEGAPMHNGGTILMVHWIAPFESVDTKFTVSPRVG